MSSHLEEKEVRRLAAEAGLDVRTVRRILGGARPRSRATADALEHAAKTLGITLWRRKVKRARAS